ncbi:uncharacterized protein LOC101240342 isoform X2 [Hydra vulgaris]|uniref:Uncharacterized protein LOC101240342 isoform X2 n=1 Tax=Hydra vulgaris TaxID=6087 RepID=A0ABM4D3V4_HYDVU
MGNTLRKTFGNMCGAEASKDLSSEDHLKPVAKPKKNKKEKKKKKTGDINNLTAQSIPEDDGISPLPVRQTEISKEIPDNKTLSTPQVFTNIDRDKNSSENSLNKTDQSNDICESNMKSKEVSQEEDTFQLAVENLDKKIYLEKDNTVFQTVNNSVENMFNTDSVRIASPLDEFNLGIHKVVVITMEELGIACADDIFKKCVDAYLLFMEDCKKLHFAVIDFQKSINDIEELAADFWECWEIYCSLIVEGNNPIDNTKKVNICDIHMKVQVMRTLCLTLNNTISRVLPDLENLLLEANTVDVIEYVKGEMVEGEKLGITSKFSAPGKYRRNIRKLRNSIDILKTVEKESKEILLLIEKSRDEFQMKTASSKHMIFDDDVTLQLRENNEETKNNLFTDPKPLNSCKESTNILTTHSINKKCENKCQLSSQNELKDQGAKSNAININHVEVNEKSDSRNSETIAVSLKSHSEKTDSPKTYIIQTIPETSTFESQNLNQSVTVMTKSVTMATDPDHLKEVLIEDEEHNMLEYGKYCFIDPTTGDIQVLRTRSRSLNSLVSFTALSQLSRSPSHSSSRSNLSRFGSFEFVTGGEVIIAEKNQAAFTSR